MNIDSNNDLTTNAFIIAKDNTGSAGTELFRVQEDGKVGIGTTSPDSLLELEAPTARIHVNSTNGFADIWLDKNAANQFAGMRIKTTGTDNWFVGTPDSDDWGNGDEFFIGDGNGASNARFVIETNGNVGIGTTSPLSKLHINDSSVSGALRITETDGTSVLFVNGSSGNVGIGTTSPSQKLQVIGDVLIGDSTWAARNLYFSDSNWGIGVTDGASFDDDLEIRFYDQGDRDLHIVGTNTGNKLVTVKSSGNVGIGTTSPSQKLHVAGNARIDGNLYLLGNLTNINVSNVNTNGSLLPSLDATFVLVMEARDGEMLIFQAE
jgi:hypothetical protein